GEVLLPRTDVEDSQGLSAAAADAGRHGQDSDRQDHPAHPHPLATLRVCGKLLMLQTLRWADEIREVDFKGVNSRAKISDKELEMSAELVDSYSEDFTPEEFTDDYQEELRKLIDAKIDQGESLDVEEAFGEGEEGEEPSGDVIDLMEALRKSVDSSRSKKGKKSSGKSSKSSS